MRREFTLKVKNGTKKNIEIYPNQSILSQDGNDYEADLENYLYDDVHMQKISRLERAYLE